MAESLSQIGRWLSDGTQKACLIPHELIQMLTRDFSLLKNRVHKRYTA